MKVLTVLLVLIPVKSFAWGMIGHRVVGELASKHLTHKAEKVVKELLGPGDSLGMCANWPDFIKSDPSWNAAAPWHYVTIEDGHTYESSVKNPKGDVVEAIGRMVKTISDKKATTQARAEALKFLVHFIGDLHQPLHSGIGADHGGNKVAVKWFGRESNLHRVWDEDLVDYQKLSYTEYAHNLDYASKDQVKQWQKDDINVWIKENMELRPLVYNIGDGNLGYDYNFKTAKTLNERLQKAGIRLAGVLNQALK